MAAARIAVVLRGGYRLRSAFLQACQSQIFLGLLLRRVFSVDLLPSCCCGTALFDCLFGDGPL